MDRQELEILKEVLCPHNEDYSEPCISPEYLEKELEELFMEMPLRTGGEVGMREGTIHPNDCGNCKHWTPWTAEEWEKYCRGHYETWGWARPKARYDFGWCDKIKAGTICCEEGYTYDGYSFSDECYDEDLHCFEEELTDG